MPDPKFRRRQVRIDPRLPMPTGIEDVEIIEANPRAVNPASQNNGYLGPIRDDSGTVGGPTNSNPVTGGPEGSNPWGTAKILKQELVINKDGTLVAEVTFELADWPDGYSERITRI